MCVCLFECERVCVCVCDRVWVRWFSYTRAVLPLLLLLLLLLLLRLLLCPRSSGRPSDAKPLAPSDRTTHVSLPLSELETANASTYRAWRRQERKSASQMAASAVTVAPSQE